MYEIRTTSSQFFMMRLIVRCALWSEKYGAFIYKYLYIYENHMLIVKYIYE